MRLVPGVSLLIALCAVCAGAFAQNPAADDTGELPGTPDPSEIPVKDDRLATGDDEILKLVLAAREGAAEAAIADVRIAVYDLPTGELVGKGRTDEHGFLTVRVPFTGAYRLETCNPNYLTTTARVNDCGSDGEPTLMCVEGFDFFTYDDALDSVATEDHILKADFYLEPLAVGEVVDLDRIFYDFDEATLRPESREELDGLVRALEQLPGLEIQLRSHTDARGSDAYNVDLSQRRAESVVDYLVDAGIDSARFSARGFGESRLLNECDDGVECTEEQHQRNRRTEFEVTAYEPVACGELPAVSVVTGS